MTPLERMATDRDPPPMDVGGVRADETGAVLRDAAARLAVAGIATARQDAELLLARALGTTRLALHVEARREVPASAHAVYEALLGRRMAQEPLQYLLGETDFCGIALAVGPGVFIPRPETELLVARALATCPVGAGVVVELCAGSAAVACALAARRPAVSLWATELSPAAAAWAHANVNRLGLRGRVTVREGDLFGPLADLAGRCDVVAANPPYIARPVLATLPAEVRRWEPALALDGGPDGLAVIARILDDAPAFLRPGGTLLLEIGEDQAESIGGRLATDPRYGARTVFRDFAGRDRVLEARRRR